MGGRPQLRSVESIVVPDERHGRVVVLRDTQGIATGDAVLPPALLPIVARFDGEHTTAEIAAEATAEVGSAVSVELVERLVQQLDEALFLEGPTFDAALARVRRDFEDAPLRPASHAGGAYPGEAKALDTYIAEQCVSRAAPKRRRGRMVGLVAPHIDPWRGAVGYGHAYGTLARTLPDEVDTFLVFGTSHAPMKEPFALLRKGYDTPLGAMPVDEAAVDALAKAARFDAYHDAMNHKREHSIEFQAAFLRHLLGKREARIIPILAGLGDAQARKRSPRLDAKVASFFDAVKKLVDSRKDRIVVVAGADLAHVGPRFGDKAFDAEQRAALEATDRDSLGRATARDEIAFWEHVASDLDTRRVCGLGPMYSLLEALTATSETRGELLHYEQTVDADDGSIVSHAAVGYFAG